MPWQSWPSSLVNEVSHTVLYFGWQHSWRCSSVFPMVASMTGRARFIAVGVPAGVSVGWVAVTAVLAGLARCRTRSITLVATVGRAVGVPIGLAVEAVKAVPSTGLHLSSYASAVNLLLGVLVVRARVRLAMGWSSCGVRWRRLGVTTDQAGGSVGAAAVQAVICTLGGVVTLGGVATLGGGALRSAFCGCFSGLIGSACRMSWSAVIAASWALMSAPGACLMASVSAWRLWQMRTSSVTISALSIGCQKQIVSEMLVACVLQGKTKKQW